ncbi:MAG: BamA/TamA family outer membrane protein [Myxococcaceae bacterium]|nr:BamA/TamA family outer membrane protein [Myxococcaceae bacterium]
MGVAPLAVVLLLLSQTPVPVVTSVELRLPPGTDPGLVAEAPGLVAVRKGQELSQRSVQRTIQLLMGTGRFADVVVYGEESEGGVAIVIEASPKQRVGEVFVEKRTLALSSDAVISASKLEQGSEYSPESMEEAIENVRLAYRRKGYLHAKVEPQATEGMRGVDVVLVVNEGEPTRLLSVSFAGETGLPLLRMRQTLNLEIGEVVDQDLVEKGAERLRTLLRTERYYRARVEAPVLDDEGRLSVPLRSGPRYAVQFRGNRRFPDTVLESINAYDGTETLDRGVVERMAQKLAAFYRYRGFHDARVLGRESVSPDGRDGLLIFEIDEGEVVVVRQVEFVGNQALTDNDLKALLVEVMKASAPQPAKVVSSFVDGLEGQGRMQEPMLFDTPAPAAETVLVESAYREAANAMRAVYRDRGYAEAKVELEPVVIEQRRAQVKFTISEGQRVFVKAVKYDGGPEGFRPGDKAGSLVGEPFSPRAVERAAQALATELARRGYVYARVEGEWAIERETEARLVFRIELGPEVSVGKVLVRGLKRTDEAVARGQLLIEEGKLLNPDDLLDSQRNLIALGIFRTAEVRLLSPETAEPIKDVLVELVEAPRLQFEGSFGYYLAEGVRVAGDVQVPNVGGQALSLQAHLQAYYFGASQPATSGRVDVSNIPQYFQVGGRANVSLQNRGLLARGLAFLTGGDTRVAKAIRGADIGTRFDTVAERVFRQSYQFNRIALVPGVDWSGRFDVGVKWARLKLTLLLQYEFDVSDVRPVRSFTGDQLPLLRTDQERLRFLFGTFALSTIRFAPTLDLRDDPVLPHRGFVLSVPIETTGAQYAVDNLGSPVTVQFIKVSGQLTTYFPLGPSIVLAISGRVGNIFPFTNSITPPVKRFFLGGAANLRGFPEDSMLPEDVRADYRGDVRNCQALANPNACSEVAQNIRAGRYTPSPGGEFFALGKAELRFPFVGDLNLGLFLEAGNLWLDPRKISTTLRPVAGTGLRYLSPIGPLALDVGFNLQPDSVVNEALFNIHFNVGVF